MTITIDDIESAAWHVGAEPIPERVDHLLELVEKFANAQPQPEPVPVPPPPPAKTEPKPKATGIADQKFCKHCQKTKPVSEFNRDRSTKDGFDYRCKACKLRQRQMRKQSSGSDSPASREVAA